MTQFLELENRSKLTAEQLIPTEQLIPNDPEQLDEAVGQTVHEASSSPEETLENPYEQCNEGPLTYYRYYFDDLEQPAIAVPEVGRSIRINYLSPGLLGAGVLTATVASGFMIANAAKEKPVVTPAQAPADAQVKQTTTQQLPTPKPAAPEKITANEAQLAQKSTRTTPKAADSLTSALKTPPKVDLSQLAIAPPPSPSMGIAAPETFGFSPQLPSRLEQSNQPIKAVLPNSPPPVTGQVAPSMQPQAAPSGQEQPIIPPTAPPVDFTAPTPLPSTMPTEALAQPGLATPAENPVLQPQSAPQQPVPSTGQPILSQGNGLPAIDQDTIGTETRVMNISSPIEQGSLPTAEPVTPDAADTDTSQFLNSPQSIQDFMNLADQAKGIEVALMSLTQQAAQEAANNNQVGSFAVLKLTEQEYLNQWQASNQASTEASYSLPTYGFIDYQRRIIAVLQDEANASTLKSASRITDPSH